MTWDANGSPVGCEWAGSGWFTYKGRTFYAESAADRAEIMRLLDRPPPVVVTHPDGSMSFMGVPISLSGPLEME